MELQNAEGKQKIDMLKRVEKAAVWYKQKSHSVPFLLEYLWTQKNVYLMLYNLTCTFIKILMI